MKLVSVDALLEQAQCTNAYFQVKSIVTGLPKIDAEPVVHGCWIEINYGTELQLICDCCGYSYLEADPNCDERHDYCPHCGAKMDEEQG